MCARPPCMLASEFACVCVRVVAAATELPDVKAMNDDAMTEDKTEGRGGVDDLIELTHLHEPAILHVLVGARRGGGRWRGKSREGGCSHSRAHAPSAVGSRACCVCALTH